jgi:hypothetical protein
MLFLVKGQVYKQEYCEDTSSCKDEIRLVEAESEWSATCKFEKYFDDLSREFVVYFRVTDAVATMVIR